MDNLKFGSRNRRGEWVPAGRLGISPLAGGPFGHARLTRWIYDYFWPWNACMLAITALYWSFVIPDEVTMHELSPGWMFKLLAANTIGVIAFYALFEWSYYVRRLQGERFKYSDKFPAEQPSEVFWFKSQNIDNFLRSFLIGLPIGTLVEELVLWAFSSGRVPMLSWTEHPGALVVWVLAAPIIHELHFFVAHRTIHWVPLYRWVHSVHHNSINASPWSSLSMHPIEHLMVFGMAGWVLALPSHPFIAVLLFTAVAFGSIVGHLGFDRLELGSTRTLTTGAYSHYLHHRHFDVNYCDNGVLPLDKWCGTWHDGTADGDRLMQERFKRKRITSA